MYTLRDRVCVHKSNRRLALRSNCLRLFGAIVCVRSCATRARFRCPAMKCSVRGSHPRWCVSVSVCESGCVRTEHKMRHVFSALSLSLFLSPHSMCLCIRRSAGRVYGDMVVVKVFFLLLRVYCKCFVM